MMNVKDYQKLRDYALKLLSFRPRTVKEISGKLLQFSMKKNFPRDLADRVIKDLSSKDFINDEEFVKWWVEQRQSFKPKGVRAIKMELLQKGVKREIIDKVIKPEDIVKEKEFELALKSISKKISLYKNLPGIDKKVRIVSFLSRRGFDWDTIYKVIDSVIGKA